MMKTENKVTKFFIYSGIVLFTVGLLSFDLDGLSFEINKKSYTKMIVATVFFAISYFRIQMKNGLIKLNNRKFREKNVFCALHFCQISLFSSSFLRRIHIFPN